MRKTRKPDADAREVLRKAAKVLRGYRLPTRPPLRPLWAQQAADAIERYLAGKAPSLDHACGLVARGRPRGAKRAEQLARRIYAEVRRGKSVSAAIEAVAQAAGLADDRTLRRYFSRYRARALASAVRRRKFLADILSAVFDKPPTEA